MRLPQRVRERVGRALAEHGLGSRVATVRAVEGGCVNRGARLVSDTGTELFLKWNPSAPPGLFDAEADGLRALADAADPPLRVPSPIAWSDAEPGTRDTSWFLMEWVTPGRATPEVEATFGHGLARLHAATDGSDFGWHRNNWIGSLPQDNTPSRSWGDFWRDRRITPQFEIARQHGHFESHGAAAAIERVLQVTPAGLADVTRPELVHGDLWGGNWFTGAADEPVLIDPAVHRGHGEVDLAMSELFGGFDQAFYEAYRETHGLSEAYDAYRRDLYQLYYLLVHVNLFGAAYEAGSLRSARRVAAALSP